MFLCMLNARGRGVFHLACLLHSQLNLNLKGLVSQHINVLKQ